jgi:hypothetical protein
VLAVSPVLDQEPDVYDMYPWDDRPAATAPHAPQGAIKAVQIALDRRDNGGDATAEVAVDSTPPAGPTRQ